MTLLLGERERTEKSAEDECRRDQDMSLLVELVVARPEVGFCDLAADERFERQRREHVQPELRALDDLSTRIWTLKRSPAQTHTCPCQVDEPVVLGKVVEDVALGPVRKDEEARDRHAQACDDGQSGRDVGHLGEPVEGRGLERPVDEE